MVRAMYDWCVDNQLTPFIVVAVDASVRVPTEFVRDGEIVLNISMDATSGLLIGNDAIEFKGRFGGVARDIYVPVNRVLAIYSRENGQGMAFPMGAESDEGEASPREKAPASVSAGKPSVVKDLKSADVPQASATDVPPRPPSGTRPTLTRVK